MGVAECPVCLEPWGVLYLLTGTDAFYDRICGNGCVHGPLVMLWRTVGCVLQHHPSRMPDHDRFLPPWLVYDCAQTVRYWTGQRRGRA